jgi:hypothetical protein
MLNHHQFLVSLRIEASRIIETYQVQHTPQQPTDLYPTQKKRAGGSEKITVQLSP